MFWILAVALLALAAGFVAAPLVRPARAPVEEASVAGKLQADSDAIVRALYHDRVAELEAEMAAGRIDPEIQRQVMDEVAAALLDDYRELEAGERVRAAEARDRAPGNIRFGWLLAFALPLAGMGLYWVVGEPTAGSVAGAAALLQLDPEADRAEIQSWQRRLERRVGLEPRDAQSWYLLGTAGLQLGDFGPAAEAFARAHEITGPDPVIDLYWLQARYLAQGGRLDAPTREIAERILARRDGHPLVLELYAIDAFRRSEYLEAVRHLNRALSNELNPAQLQTLLAGLAEARARMEPLQPTVAVAITAAAGAPRDAVLFVIARPPGGGIPYAVVRRPAGLLPLTVHLDDTVSMNPDLPLSRAPVVEIVVRLSRSGTPTAHPGDWEWRSSPLDVAELIEPLSLAAELVPPEPAAAAAITP